MVQATARYQSGNAHDFVLLDPITPLWGAGARARIVPPR